MGDPTDQELFDSAIANEPAQDLPVEPSAQSEAAPDTNRDDKGRFAPREAAEARAEEPAPSAEQPEKQGGRVPSGLLREEKENRRRLEAELAELRGQMKAFQQFQQPKPTVQPQLDPIESLLADPDNWAKQQLNPVSEELRQTREFYSRKDAIREHGAEKVDEAYRALDAAINSGAVNRDAVLAELNRSMDPFGDIMNWYGRHKILSDPEAYERQIIEKFLASQNQQPATAAQTQQPAGSTIVRLPQSLNRATSAASSNAGGGGDDVSDAALFASTTSRRR